MKLDYDNKRTREGRGVVEAAANADKPPIVLMEELYQLPEQSAHDRAAG